MLTQGLREWTTWVGGLLALAGVYAVVFLTEEQVGAMARKAALVAPGAGALLVMIRQSRKNKDTDA